MKVVIGTLAFVVISVSAQSGGGGSVLETPPIGAIDYYGYDYPDEREEYGNYMGPRYGDGGYYVDESTVAMVTTVEEGTPIEPLYPEEPSACMPLVAEKGEPYDYDAKESLGKPRTILSYAEINSAKINHAVMKVTEYYTQKKSGSVSLEMTQVKSGCRQVFSGELLFLVFDAKEVVFCDDLHGPANCTGDIMLERECRARVHVSTEQGWYPFFCACNSHEYYARDWNRMKMKN